MKIEDKDITYVSNILANPELIHTEEFRIWIKDKKHAELFWNLKAAFDNLALENMQLPELSTEWETFCKRVQADGITINDIPISQEQHSEKPKSKLYKLIRWSVAASILLIASGTYFLSRTNSNHENIVVVEHLTQTQSIIISNDTLPAKPKSTKNSKPIVYNTIQTPRGKDTTYTFSDGTEVKLNAESVLKFPPSFDKSARIVIVEGEAYFKVAHEKNRPFIVESHGVQTKVLGTVFNIKALSKDRINVTLVEGSVLVKNLESEVTALLHPGEDARYSVDGSFDVKEVDVELSTAWTQGYLYFENTSLVDIMRELGHWYNVNIEFADTEVMHQHFNFWVDRNQDIEQALSLLQEVGKTNFVYKNNTVIVYASKQN